MMPTPLEALAVYAVVALCAAYCVWVFMPAVMKRWTAGALLSRFPRLLGTSRTLQSLTQDSAACGSACSNCASAGDRTPPAHEHKVHWAKGQRSPPG